MTSDLKQREKVGLVISQVSSVVTSSQRVRWWNRSFHRCNKGVSKHLRAGGAGVVAAVATVHAAVRDDTATPLHSTLAPLMKRFDTVVPVHLPKNVRATSLNPWRLSGPRFFYHVSFCHVLMFLFVFFSNIFSICFFSHVSF